MQSTDADLEENEGQCGHANMCNIPLLEASVRTGLVATIQLCEIFFAKISKNKVSDFLELKVIVKVVHFGTETEGK